MDEAQAEVKRGRGRPPGVKNAPRTAKKGKDGAYLPYRTPEELQEAMKRYFDMCNESAVMDWHDIIDAFVTLADDMKKHPTWSNHKTSFDRLTASIKNSGVFPDEAGMRIQLGLTHSAYQEYKEDPAYEAVFDWAQDMRECWAARRLANDPKSFSTYMAILKQPGNGGWTDKKMETKDDTLHVKADGVGGMRAFK